METPRTDSYPNPTVTLGEYAHHVIEVQYHQILKQEKKVLADQNPEHLHQMRVGTRRLRVALQVFAGIVELPKVAGEKRLRDLARILGALRDLDVQQAALQNDYYPKLEKAEQQLLDQALKQLHQHRQKAFAKVKATPGQPRYQKLKTAYATWLDQPQYTAIAQLPLLTLLPDLLSPLLASLLLHPGWLMPTDALMQAEELMHDLRKACKRVRYQAEFFQPLYGDALKTWLNEIKQIQELLGQVHDTQVLLQVLEEQLSPQAPLPGVKRAIAEQQDSALITWEPLRQKYLHPEFRHSLRLMILQPLDAIAPDPKASPRAKAKLAPKQRKAKHQPISAGP